MTNRLLDLSSQRKVFPSHLRPAAFETALAHCRALSWYLNVSIVFGSLPSLAMRFQIVTFGDCGFSVFICFSSVCCCPEHVSMAGIVSL